MAPVPSVANQGDVATFAGLGTLIHDTGVAFRVWAPHAEQVSVVGSFNDWDPQRHPMQQEEGGCWHCDTADAHVGDEYRYWIKNGEQEFTRIDPRAREVTNSVGNAVIHDPTFDWEDDDFHVAPLNELVIYEMHIGTFGASDQPDLPAGFQQAVRELDHLQAMGVNCVELMPVAEFSGDYSWGYNPAQIFAVESAYGGPKQFKQFIKEAHRRGIAVVLDVVYNHFGPSDLSLWQFDGWQENNQGGIYFYNDWKAETPWGKTRPDYGRGEVRQYIYDNALMWLEEFRLDGLRFDMTLYIRHVRGNGDPGCELPDGWSLMQWINREVRERFPGKILIAEDLRNLSAMTQAPDSGGAGFHTQWGARFVHPIRGVLTVPNDEDRSLDVVQDALTANFNGDPFQRVVYTESHDEVANGHARIPSEVMPDNPDHWIAEKRATLGMTLVLTAPGVPMLFQGQEFLEDEWFRDTDPLDWNRIEDYRGMVRLVRDLIGLRLNKQGRSRGLTGSPIAIICLDQNASLLAWHRWHSHGSGDDVVVICNFACEARSAFVQFPAAGVWKLQFNGDAKVYSDRFHDVAAEDVVIEPHQDPGRTIDVGPYSALIYTLE